MSSLEWELVELARTRAMADRLQQEALDRAEAAGITEPRNQTAFAFGWLAGEAARRIVRLENARGGARVSAARDRAGVPSVSTGLPGGVTSSTDARSVPDPSAQGAAAPTAQPPQRGGVTPIRPRASRK